MKDHEKTCIIEKKSVTRTSKQYLKCIILGKEIYQKNLTKQNH